MLQSKREPEQSLTEIEEDITPCSKVIKTEYGTYPGEMSQIKQLDDEISSSNQLPLNERLSQNRDNFLSWANTLDEPIREEKIDGKELQNDLKIKYDAIPDYKGIVQLYEKDIQKMLTNKSEKKNWNEDDILILIWILMKYIKQKNKNFKTLEDQDWLNISQMIPGKSQDSTKFKWLQMLKCTIQVAPWTKEENQVLLRLVEQRGKKAWQEISKILYETSKTKIYRSSKQCREHFNNHLDPNVKKGTWNQEEDFRLLQLAKEKGKKWSEIARLLNGRTENSVKNRYHALIRKEMEKNNEIKPQNVGLVKINEADEHPKENIVISKLINTMQQKLNISSQQIPLGESPGQSVQNSKTQLPSEDDKLDLINQGQSQQQQQPLITSGQDILAQGYNTQFINGFNGTYPNQQNQVNPQILYQQQFIPTAVKNFQNVPYNFQQIGLQQFVPFQNQQSPPVTSLNINNVLQQTQSTTASQQQQQPQQQQQQQQQQPSSVTNIPLQQQPSTNNGNFLQTNGNSEIQNFQTTERSNYQSEANKSAASRGCSIENHVKKSNEDLKQENNENQYRKVKIRNVTEMTDQFSCIQAFFNPNTNELFLYNDLIAPGSQPVLQASSATQMFAQQQPQQQAQQYASPPQQNQQVQNNTIITPQVQQQSQQQQQQQPQQNPGTLPQNQSQNQFQQYQLMYPKSDLSIQFQNQQAGTQQQPMGMMDIMYNGSMNSMVSQNVMQSQKIFDSTNNIEYMQKFGGPYQQQDAIKQTDDQNKQQQQQQQPQLQSQQSQQGIQFTSQNQFINQQQLVQNPQVFGMNGNGINGQQYEKAVKEENAKPGEIIQNGGLTGSEQYIPYYQPQDQLGLQKQQSSFQCQILTQPQPQQFQLQQVPQQQQQQQQTQNFNVTN